MPRMEAWRQWIRESYPDRKVDSWCEFDQRQDGHGMHGFQRTLSVRCIKFRFERVQDAVLFKLTHGGKDD